MANTIDGNLTNNQLSANSVGQTRAEFCALANISQRLIVPQPCRTGIVEGSLISSAGSTATNVSNYQTGDSTVARVPVTVAHYVRRVHFAAPENDAALSVANHLSEGLVNQFDADLAAIVAVKIVAGSFGAADITSTAANFDISDLEALAAACIGTPRTALLVAGAMPGCSNDLVRDAGRWVYPGIDSGVFEAKLGGDADVAVVASPGAFAHVNEKPLSFATMPSDKVTVTPITLPTLQIAAWRCVWYDLATRAYWLSIENLFGIEVADATRLTYAKSS